GFQLSRDMRYDHFLVPIGRILLSISKVVLDRVGTGPMEGLRRPFYEAHVLAIGVMYDILSFRLSEPYLPCTIPSRCMRINTGCYSHISIVRYLSPRSIT